MTFKREKIAASDKYLALRWSVLFDVWFKGADAVQLTPGLCRTCGFITNIPRVETSDVDAKYAYLAERGVSGISADQNSEREKQRSENIFQHVAHLVKGEGTRRILDFGGSDGRLMHSFLKRGHECFLVDYCEKQFPGVERLGATERDIPEDCRFDIIVCNHVIEHVADPVGVLRRLGRHLNENGHLFVEVPMEIWGQRFLQQEPVTHVNFFTPGSLAHALSEAGLHVSSSRLGGYLHPNGQTYLALSLIHI